MPLIRGKIEETGLLEDWQKVETFSCVNVAEMEHPETAEQTELKSFESKATEFLKPGEKITQETWQAGKVKTISISKKK